MGTGSSRILRHPPLTTTDRKLVLNNASEGGPSAIAFPSKGLYWTPFPEIVRRSGRLFGYYNGHLANACARIREPLD